MIFFLQKSYRYWPDYIDSNYLLNETSMSAAFHRRAHRSIPLGHEPKIVLLPIVVVKTGLI